MEINTIFWFFILAFWFIGIVFALAQVYRRRSSKYEGQLSGVKSSLTSSETQHARVGDRPDVSVKNFETATRSKDIHSILSSTRDSWSSKLSIFSKKTQFVGEDIDKLEEVLYGSDMGPQIAHHLVESIKGSVQNMKYTDIMSLLKTKAQDILFQEQDLASKFWEKIKARSTPSVWLVCGVNGVGKTTSIGKLAFLAKQKNIKVLIASADTFRAAAREQLTVWADRAGGEIFAPQGVNDPGAISHNACQKALNGDYDVVLIDTAGRLHTQDNLMSEIKKVKMVVGKIIPEAPHEVILVLDASTGQNAVRQAQNFDKTLGVTGSILTKLDGSSKGGVALSLKYLLNMPILFLGVGEGIEDLADFSPEAYANSLFA